MAGMRGIQGMRGLKPVKVMNPLDNLGDQVKDDESKLKRWTATVGEARAQAAQELARTRPANRTLPELVTESWLIKHGVRYEAQFDLGFAHPDFVLFDTPTAPTGAVVWEVQGEYWHADTVAHDQARKQRLLNTTARGRQIQQVIELWEKDIYDSESVFEQALQGVGLRDSERAAGGWREAARWLMEIASELLEWITRVSQMVDHLAGNFRVRLGDTAGANKFSVQDSSGVEVASINSDGKLATASTVKVTNLNADLLDGHEWAEIPAGGNPTASAGLTAVNGSAATFMRSDAAPALDVSISPIWTGTHRFNNDIYPAGATAGIAQRLINQFQAPAEHFRSGVAPAGYSWQASPFAGTPYYLNWAAPSDFAQIAVTGATDRVFFSKSISNSAAAWQGKALSARLRTANGSETGLRIDDSSDNNYSEVYLTATNMVTTISMRNRVGGGTPSVLTTAIAVPVSTFFSLYLLCYWDGTAYTILPYLFTEDGNTLNMPITSGVITWCPAAGRAGLIVNKASNTSGFDWMTNTFG